MADLGNLYFDIMFRDKTEEQRKKMKADLIKNLKAELDIDFDKKRLVSDIKTKLQGEEFKINVVIDKAKTSQAVREALKSAGVNSNFSGSDLRAAKAAAIQAKADAAAAASRELARQRAARAEKAELALANARNRGSDAMSRQLAASLKMDGAMQRHIGLAGQLRNEFYNLYSIYTINRFFHSVVGIGGELENQRIAISSILRDAGKANAIFGQIKSLAVQSPFGVTDLNQYAKQLSAYSVPYNELYDTMKRLADISAGVGVDMGRIILAYGQIKAAKFLKGTELRQLTEANIPMVDKLSERFSRLEGRIVSAGEVMDMISKKKVSFEDVKSVLWDMTGDGGMFHNMQEVLSESVKSKWKNLSDAIDIMLGDIAESNNGILKGTAEAATAVVQNWESLVPVLYSLAAGFGLYKIATITATKALGSNYIATQKSIMAAKHQEAARMRAIATVRKLTAEERIKIATSNQMTNADYRQMIATKALTKEKAVFLMALGKLKGAQAGYVGRLLGMSAAEVRAAIGGTFLRRSLNMGNIVFKLATASVVKFGAALGTLLFNPFTIVFAGLSAAYTMWQNHEEKMESMNERIAEMQTKASEGLKNLTKNAEKFASVDLSVVSEGSLMSHIEEMKTVLKDYSPLWAETFNDAFKTDEAGRQIHSLTEQFKILRGAIDDTREAHELLGKIAGYGEQANNLVDGYWDDSLTENIKDYVKALGKEEHALSEITARYEVFSAAMQEVIGKNKEFAEAVTGKNLREQLEIIRDYPGALKLLKWAVKDLSDKELIAKYQIAFTNVDSILKKDLNPDADAFLERYKDMLRSDNWDLENLSGSRKMAITSNLRGMLSESLEKATPEIRKKIEEKLIEKPFNINLSAEFNGQDSAITDLQKKFDDATDGVFKTQIMVSTDPSQIMEEIRKTYKEAKEGVDQLKPLLIKAGIDMSSIGNSVESLPLWQRSMVDNYVKQQKIVKAAEKGANDMGFSLTGPGNKDSSNKDPFAERMKERVDLIKDAYSEYRKWADIVGKKDALNKVKSSGLFDSLFKGKELVDLGSYREELEKILGQIDDKTEKRRELKISIRKVLLDIDAGAAKEAAEQAVKKMERYADNAAKKWEVYKKLLDAGANKGDASMYAFGVLTDYERRAEYLIDTLQEKFREKGVEIPFTMSEDDAEHALGGKDSPLYKELFNAWKSAKKSIEEENIDIAVDEARILAKARTTMEKIRALSEEYAGKTGLSIGVNGELVGDEIGLSKVQSAYLDEYKRKLLELKSTLLQLLPVWEKIFGDKENRSYKDLDEAERVAKEILANAKVLRDKDGNPTGFSSYFTLSNGETQAVEGTYDMLNKIIKSIPQIQKAKRAINPFKKLLEDISNLFKKKDGDGEGEDPVEEKKRKITALAASAAACADDIGNLAGQLSSVFEALGDASMAQSMDNLQAAMSSISNIGKGFAQGGPFGGIMAAIGEGIGWITRLARRHDDKIEEQIKASEARVKTMQALYNWIEASLKNHLDNGADMDMSKFIAKDKARLAWLDDKIETGRRGKLHSKRDRRNYKNYVEEANMLRRKVNAANGEGGVYGYQRRLMNAQIAELKSQRDAALEKKKYDPKQVEDLNNQIAEMEQKARDFAADTMAQLYGIDLKDWASQLGDALFDAWKKGEDGAEAFKRKSGEILANVANSIQKKLVLEPAMKDLYDMLYGKTGEDGILGKDFTPTEEKMEKVGSYLMKMSEQSGKFMEFLEKLNEYMKKNHGIDLKGLDKDKGGLAKSIQGVTEETADLLASYLNAIRADVFAKRELLRRLVDELIPNYNGIAQAQLQQLTMIRINTDKNVVLVEEIRDILHRNVNGINKFNV